MTSFKDLANITGRSHTNLAHIIGVGPKTITRWLDSDAPLHAKIIMLLLIEHYTIYKRIVDSLTGAPESARGATLARKRAKANSALVPYEGFLWKWTEPSTGRELYQINDKGYEYIGTMHELAGNQYNCFGPRVMMINPKIKPGTFGYTCRKSYHTVADALQDRDGTTHKSTYLEMF